MLTWNVFQLFDRQCICIFLVPSDFSKFVCINELKVKGVINRNQRVSGVKTITSKYVLIIKVKICVTTPFEFQKKKGMYNQTYMILELPQREGLFITKNCVKPHAKNEEHFIFKIDFTLKRKFLLPW